YRRGESRYLRLDTLQANLPLHRYRLRDPVMVSLSDSAPTVGALTLLATDGSGMVHVDGQVPSSAPGALAVQVVGLDLHDLYGLISRDTLGVGGDWGLAVQVGGTSAAPTLHGLARLADGRFGDFHAPLVEGVINYGDRRLDANLDLWRTGEDILQIEAQLPFDLAFRGVKQRRIE